MNNNIQTLKYKESEIRLDLNGGTLISWVNLGKEVFYQGTNHRRSGVPILFPFANPLHDGIFKNSGLSIGQHGFARDLVWELEKMEEKSISISLSTHNVSEEMQLAYPYKFKATVIIGIEKTGILEYTFRVENLDSTALPIAPGLHPYFPIKHTDKSNLRIIDKHDQLIFNGASTNWNELRDGIFNSFKQEARIQFPNNGQIQIIENGENLEFQNLVVWSQPTSEPDFNFVCVEPFTRGTDAINEDPILVEPRRIWRVSLKFIVN